MIRYWRQRANLPWRNFKFLCNPTPSLFTLQTFFFSQQSAELPEESNNDSPLLHPVFDSHGYAKLLQHYIKTRDIANGRTIHCDILKKGSCIDSFAWNIIINMYTKAELLDDAHKVFDEMPERNTISFVTLIQGYSLCSQFVESVELFLRLHREGYEMNPFVFTTVLKLFVNMEYADLCWNVHACIYKLGHGCNAFVGTTLIDAYTACGFVDGAKEVFDGIVEKDMFTWTGMMTCYCENECFVEALEVFSRMRNVGIEPNNYAFASTVKACTGLLAYSFGKGIHACSLKTRWELDPYVGGALLDMYTKCGDVDAALVVFNAMPEKDMILWSFMIARYAQSNRCEEAVKLFFQMKRASVTPNQYTYASLLQACATMEGLELGKQTHCHVLKIGLDADIFVTNALMDVYAKCERMEDSEKLFFNTPHKNDVSWNTMIVGYVQLQNGEEALRLFLQMLNAQLIATEVTYSSVLRACASLAALEPGIQIHGLISKTVFSEYVSVRNSLVDMYAKCGSIRNARLLFDTMDYRDEVSWNSIISGYSLHGLGRDALKLFEKMRETDARPNNITFVGILSACSNAGLVEQGRLYFNSMYHNHGIEPCIEHYTCMVWLLGRSGLLDEAVKLIYNIPCEPSVMVWRALLGACVIHNNVEIGKLSAEHVLEMEPEDESAFVLLSNIYASARSWGDVVSVRKLMKRKGVKKEPGLSWIENQNKVYYFSVGDASHPKIRLIHGMLEWLSIKIKNAGYVSNQNVVLLDMEDDEKDRHLWVHSERLALAFGLISTPPGRPIRIIKNLRICLDCHAAIKFISKVVQREIVVRDMNRFHHFENGNCSCGDYW